MKFATASTTTVSSGRSASKSAKNSEKRGMTYVIRIAMRPIESVIRMTGYTRVETTLRVSAMTVFWYLR